MAKPTKETMMKHCVEYLLPGSFYPESSTKTLEKRSVEEAIERAHERAFAFVLYDLPAVDFEYDETLYSVAPKRQNVSGRYYIDGTVMTIAELELENRDGKLDILIANARGNDWPLMIRTRMGNWQPFEVNDTVVSTPAKVAS